MIDAGPSTAGWIARALVGGDGPAAWLLDVGPRVRTSDNRADEPVNRG